MGDRICTIPDCDRKRYARGMCDMHYQRVKARRELDLFPGEPSAAERLIAGLERKPNGCLEWTGRTSRGYGVIDANGKGVRTHRLAWTLANGPIPDGMAVLHRCDNPPCCDTNPSEMYPEGHLFLGTHADNMADMVAKGRQYGPQVTHCPQGHEYAGDNLYISPTGRRVCRECVRASRRRWHAKMKERDAVENSYQSGVESASA